MKSLILTVLYLARDTIHRWFTRLSSPVARVLVVFFLTLCALCFLGTYVISAKVIRDRVHRQGGDLVQLNMNAASGEPVGLPGEGEVDSILGADSLAMSSLGSGRITRGEKASNFRIITCDFARMGQWMPLLAPGGGPTMLIGDESKLRPGPARIELFGQVADVFVRRVSDGSLHSRLVEQEDLLFIQPDAPLVKEAQTHSPYRMHTLLLRVRDYSSSEAVRRAVDYCENYLRLEKARGYIVSALPLLREMDIILSNQVQCRIAFCAGIACIVGILLTALAGMEYRQNEYIYTLMKSFGIHPLLLVGAFIAENLLLVGSSFLAAVWVFMYFQRFLVQQFFKTGSYSLELAEIMPELQLVAVSLLGCVLVSSVPIIFAANRDIGRVLK